MGVYQAWEEDGSLAIEYFGGRGIGIAKLAISNRDGAWVVHLVSVEDPHIRN